MEDNIDLNNLNFDTYHKLAMASRKQWENMREMQSDVGLGLCGEAGEVADIIKKDLAGAKQIDIEHLKEELGDVLWYLAEACDCFNLDLKDIAKANIVKLKKRHPNGFSGYGIR